MINTQDRPRDDLGFVARRTVPQTSREPAVWAIGSAQPSHADEVIALWHACGLTRPWNDPAADLALALDDPAATVLVARDAGAIVGSLMVGFDGHRGWVYCVAVAEAQRFSGLGRALMAAAEGRLRARGAPKLQLMVRGDNDAALGFYQALELERQDVVVLGRRLDDGAKT